MTTIINKYIGITHPIEQEKWGEEELKTVHAAWKATNCPQGIHLFDEVWSVSDHYLHCDACGMEIHISKIVLPDGKDDVVGEER